MATVWRLSDGTGEHHYEYCAADRGHLVRFSDGSVGVIVGWCCADHRFIWIEIKGVGKVRVDERRLRKTDIVTALGSLGKAHHE